MLILYGLKRLVCFNVAIAVREVGAFGLDVCSGVRTNGDLDTPKLHAFCTQIGLAQGV